MRTRKLRNQEKGKQYLDVPGAAEFLGLSSGTIRQYVFNHRIPYYKTPRGEVRFEKGELERWDKKREQEKKPVAKFNIDEETVYKEDSKILLNILGVLTQMQQNLKEVTAELKQERD